MQLRILALLALLPFAAACSSDSTSACTMVGCQSGFTIALQAATWPAGKYSVKIVADGVEHRCEASLPIDQASPSSCDSDALMLVVSGSALPVAQQKLDSVQVFPIVQDLQVTISRDGTPLATQQFVPNYKTTSPNGPECEPTCTQDSATMTL